MNDLVPARIDIIGRVTIAITISLDVEVPGIIQRDRFGIDDVGLESVGSTEDDCDLLGRAGHDRWS